MRTRLLLPLLIPAAFVGCDRPAPNPTATVVATHTVRGQIESLPEKDNPASSLTIKHEDIPGWDRGDGTKGMRSMEMAFPVAQGVSLDGLAIGDKVEFVVEQTPRDPVPYRVVRIGKLPPDAQLDFARKP